MMASTLERPRRTGGLVRWPRHGRPADRRGELGARTCLQVWGSHTKRGAVTRQPV